MAVVVLFLLWGGFVDPPTEDWFQRPLGVDWFHTRRVWPNGLDNCRRHIPSQGQGSNRPRGCIQCFCICTKCLHEMTQRPSQQLYRV